MTPVLICGMSLLILACYLINRRPGKPVLAILLFDFRLNEFSLFWPPNVRHDYMYGPETS